MPYYIYNMDRISRRSPHTFLLRFLFVLSAVASIVKFDAAAYSLTNRTPAFTQSAVELVVDESRSASLYFTEFKAGSTGCAPSADWISKTSIENYALLLVDENGRILHRLLSLGQLHHSFRQTLSFSYLTPILFNSSRLDPLPAV